MSDLSLSKKTLVTPPTAAALYDGTIRGGKLRVNRYRFLSLDLAEPNLGVPVVPFGFDPPLDLITNFYNLSVLIYAPSPTSDTRTYYLSSDIKGTRGWTNLVGDALFDSLERPDLKTTDAALEELLYKFPEILTFTLNESASPIFLEAGSYFSPAILDWTYNKTNLAAISATYLFFNNNTTTYLSDQQYRFRSIPLLSPGTFPSIPTITVTTPSPSLQIRQQPSLIAEMDSTNTLLTGIRVDGQGIFTTYDINVLYSVTPSIAPEIEYLELEKFIAPPLSSLNIGDLGVSTTVTTTSTFTLTAVDWAGAKAIKSLQVRSTGYIYYGRSINNVDDITPSDITNNINPSKGDLARIRAVTSRSYTSDCSPDGASPNGYYFFIAFPDYTGFIVTPKVFAKGFEVTNQEKNLTITNIHGVTINYKVLISNNRQTGRIPLVIT